MKEVNNLDGIIHIYDEYEVVPDNSTLIGDIRIGDSGFSTNCTYEQVISLAKKEAKQANAKIIEIVDHRNPDALSSCHRIKANLYRYDQIEVASDLALNSANSLIHFYTTFKYVFLSLSQE